MKIVYSIMADIAKVLLLIILTTCSVYSQSKLCQYVDPFIGTGGHGHTFPGPTSPFGMMQLGPDTRLTGWDGCSGYHYSDTIVYGFSHTHLSGTGVSDYGDLLIMPFVGETNFHNGSDGKSGYSSPFQKTKEIAEPGYYSTFLDKYGIKVELSTADRSGMHKYHFPSSADKSMIIDLVHRDEVLDSYLKKVSEYELEGYRHSKAWAENQKLFFVIQADQPINNMLFETEKDNSGTENQQKGTNIRASLSFGGQQNTLQLRVGISSVDIEGARRNLEAEINHWNFEKFKNDAQEKWESELSKIIVEDENEDKKIIFYTALYHTMIAPNLFMDVDGRYLGTDGQIHQSKDHTHYTIFSLWDTYRAAHPLYTIIDQTRTSDFIKTFEKQYEQGGSLPMWELAGNYTGCMIGYHAAPVIADAYVKGIRDYDAEHLLNAMVQDAQENNLGKESYRSNGLLTIDTEHECVSKTLEYAYDDWTIAVMADSLGKKEWAAEFYQNAANYQNVFDPSTKCMRARLNNRWFYPFHPAEVNYNYTEANAWQYSYYVPQDIDGWVQLLGGKSALEDHLDALFAAESETSGRDQVDITGLIGQYAHGNEPSHHISYLYNFVDKPAKTQEKVRYILDQLYSSEPDGLSGNEDCGQMSAWLVLSAMGFYPVTPGSTQYILGSPWFDKVTINLENGAQTYITANHNSKANKFVQKVNLNNGLLRKSFIQHRDIMEGSSIDFYMDFKPNNDAFESVNISQLSSIQTHQIVAVPVLVSGDRAFQDSTLISIECVTPDADVYFTLNGNEVQRYNEAFHIHENVELEIYAQKEGYEKSPSAKSVFYKIEENRKIEIEHSYASHYAAGGDQALIDYLRGGNDYRAGSWQGYEHVDLIATIELEEVRELSKLSIGFLQDENSWIFMPLEVEFWVSQDGQDFQYIGKSNNDVSPKEKGSIIKQFSISAKSKAKFIKVKAKNRGYCPYNHKGAGGKCWIFADEIVID